MCQATGDSQITVDVAGEVSPASPAPVGEDVAKTEPQLEEQIKEESPVDEQALDEIALKKSLDVITAIVGKNGGELIQMHRKFTDLLRFQDKMQAELEQHRSGLYKQLVDPLLAFIARIYVEYFDNVAKVEDPKLRNNFNNMFGELEDKLAEFDVETYQSDVGDQMSRRFCKIRNKVATTDKALHGAVVKSYNKGFFIGPRVLIHESVDVYIKEESNG